MDVYGRSIKADAVRAYKKLNPHPIDIALQKARKKAEKVIFWQKVQAHLIVGVALIVIFLTFYW